MQLCLIQFLESAGNVSYYLDMAFLAKSSNSVRAAAQHGMVSCHAWRGAKRWKQCKPLLNHLRSTTVRPGFSSWCLISSTTSLGMLLPSNRRDKSVICSSLAKESPTALAPSAPMLLPSNRSSKWVICWNLATASPTTLASPGPRLFSSKSRSRRVTFSGFEMASKIVLAATHSKTGFEKLRRRLSKSRSSRCLSIE